MLKTNPTTSPILSKDNDGFITLTEKDYVPSPIDVDEYSATISWIMLRNNNIMCLVKNFLADINFVKEDSSKMKQSISKYNNIIIPYIGKNFFNIDTVNYFVTRFLGTNEKINVNPNLKYLITLDEKKEDEEIFEGWNMLLKTDMDDTVSFSDRIHSTSEFLCLRNIPKHLISDVISELIRQEIFKKFIKYVDNHNANWGIAIDGKKVRAFPSYDFDLCCGIKNKQQQDIETVTDTGHTDLNHFIEQYKNLPWIKTYLSEIIDNFDIEQIFEKSQLPIPHILKQYYREFFHERYNVLENTYKQLFSEKSHEEGEIK